MARLRSDEAIGVDGLSDLSKALREIGGKELVKELRLTNKSVATKEAKHASSFAASQGSTLAHVAPSIKAAAGAGFAGVAIGGPAYPEAVGAEFGGRGRPTTQQFQPWRGSGAGAGYAVYPTIRKDAPQIVDEYDDLMKDLIQKAGLA